MIVTLITELEVFSCLSYNKLNEEKASSQNINEEAK